MANIHFYLPHTADGPSLFIASSELRLQPAASVSDCLQLDFSRLRAILPSGVTFLSNLIYWFGSRGWIVTFVNHDDPSRRAIAYLDDAGFFLEHEGLEIRPRAKIRKTTLALERIETTLGHNWLRTRFIPWLAPTLGLSEASLYAFEISVQEVITNIRDHSGRDAGSIFVQHFPSKKEVVISIADFGSGIPATVRTVAPQLKDAEAIIRAAQPGFSSKPKPRRRGAGLDFLIETVVRTNGGRVSVFSGTGHVAFFMDQEQLRVSEIPGAGFCPGVTFDITLRTDTIERIDDEPEALEW